MRTPLQQSPFRPQHEPARTFYDTFQTEATKRAQRTLAEWCEAELLAVHEAACRYAAHHGLAAPTLEQVARAEVSARGHTDYGSKWALGVAAHFQNEAHASVG